MDTSDVPVQPLEPATALPAADNEPAIGVLAAEQVFPAEQSLILTWSSGEEPAAEMLDRTNGEPLSEVFVPGRAPTLEPQSSTDGVFPGNGQDPTAGVFAGFGQDSNAGVFAGSGQDPTAGAYATFGQAPNSVPSFEHAPLAGSTVNPFDLSWDEGGVSLYFQGSWDGLTHARVIDSFLLDEPQLPLPSDVEEPQRPYQQDWFAGDDRF